MRQRGPNGRDVGFTVVELVVVVVIVGVILGLLAPAWQRSREASHRIQCQNNLRQIALALHNYELQWGAFPPGYVTGLDADGGESGPGWGWGASMLPQLEQVSMAQALHRDDDVFDPSNGSVRSIRLSSFTCPSGRPPETWAVRDGLPPDGPFGAELGRVAASSYVGVAGPGPLGRDRGGFFARNWGVRYADVRDGMGQTLMVGERHHTLGQATWTAAIPHAALVPADPRQPITIGGPSMVLGHVTVEDGPGGPKTRPDGFRGEHGVPGANFAIGDGSVRFLRASMRPAIYRALTTRAGGEMISDDD